MGVHHSKKKKGSKKPLRGVLGVLLISLSLAITIVLTQYYYQTTRKQLEQTDASAASDRSAAGKTGNTTSSVCARGWLCMQGATYQVTHSGGTSIEIDSSNRPHVSTVQPDSAGSWTVEYSYLDQNGWRTEAAFRKPTERPQITELSLDSLGNPHIFIDTYYSNPVSASIPYNRTAEIYHIFKDTNGWQSELVVSKSVLSTQTGPAYLFLFSSTIDQADKFHLVYYDRHGGKFIYAHQDVSGWKFEDLENTYDNHFLLRSSIDTDSNNRPHILLNKIGNSESKLIYKYKDASGWQTEDLGNNMISSDIQIKLDGSNRPHIVYSQGSYYNPQYAPPENVIYAYKDSSGWHKEQIEEDKNNNYAEHLSLELDANAYPHLTYNYYDSLCKGDPCGALVYNYKDASGWHKTVVEQAKVAWYALASRGVDIGLDSQNKPHIVYTGISRNSNLAGGFRYATRQ